MRVLVDASCLKKEQGGIRSYTLGLVRAIAKVPGFHVVVATPFPGDFDGDPVETITIKSNVEPPLRRAAWRERHLPALVTRCRAQAVIIPLHEHPLRALDVPTVMVMHDLGPLVAPVLYGRTRWARYLLTLPKAARTATAIVSMSHKTQLDLLANVAIPAEKCTVIETGTQPLPPPDLESAPSDRSYALYVGTLLPHKNIRTLVEAFAMEDYELPEQLALAGPHTEEQQEQVLAWAQQAGLDEDRVRMLGYVPAATLSALYRRARVSVLPSLHEGFGAPIVEAMRVGIPVVASDIPAHREVARDGAQFVSELLSPEAWAAAISRAATDEALRTDLVSRGRARASYYTWDRVGSDWAELLTGLVEQR